MRANLECFIAFWKNKDGSVGFHRQPLTEQAAISLAEMKKGAGCSVAGVHELVFDSYPETVERMVHSQCNAGIVRSSTRLDCAAVGYDS